MVLLGLCTYMVLHVDQTNQCLSQSCVTVQNANKFERLASFTFHGESPYNDAGLPFVLGYVTPIKVMCFRLFFFYMEGNEFHRWLE